MEASAKSNNMKCLKQNKNNFERQRNKNYDGNSVKIIFVDILIVDLLRQSLPYYLLLNALLCSTFHNNFRFFFLFRDKNFFSPNCDYTIQWRTKNEIRLYHLNSLNVLLLSTQRMKI